MTCFSIQKSLVLALAALFLTGWPLHGATAQQSDLSISTQKAVEDRAQDDKQKAERAAQDERVQSPIVVELFTTSDCTACIYADRMLYDSMKDKNVIALSCHINDLSELKKRGDKDAMGDESSYNGPMDPCVFRQWTYETSRVNQDVTINIPQFVFNGYDQLNTADLTYYKTLLNSYHYAFKNKALEVFMQWKDDDTITVNLPQDPNYDKIQLNASVWLIRYKDMAVERIDSGLNKGRVLRFSNIIQDIRHIAKWHGAMRSIDVDVPAPQGGKERGGYVILVAEMMGEPVLAAGKLSDYPTLADKQEALLKAQKSQERTIAPAPAPAVPDTAPPAAAKSYITP